MTDQLAAAPVEAKSIMRKDKVIILTMFILAVAGAVGFHLLRSAGVVNPIGGEPRTPVRVEQFRGISLQLHNSEPEHPYEQYIDEIAATGANTIALVVTAYQENCASTSLFIEARKSPSDARLRKLIDHAHKKKLRVILMPIILLENPREDEWRGKIAPSDWDAWWEDYSNYIMHYTYIAEAAGVEMFIVGSELVSTETFTERWRELIGQVRRHYAGLVSYSANWDHYRPPKWWADVDVIGMTTYYDLTGGQEPTLDVLMEAWKKIKKEVLDWQAGINRPILFTEVGWPNQATCGQYPWDYYCSSDDPDPQAQANCFEAFFQTWLDEEAVAGFIVWEWRNHPSQLIGPKDTSYVPCGKPALEVIRRYYQRGADSQPAKSPETRNP